MADRTKDDSFKVVDRRPFTAEGELRQEALAQERQEHHADRPAKPEANNKSAAASEPNPFAKAEPAERSPAFENLVRMMASNAAMVLGAYADPQTGQPIVDPEAARELIDMLDALHAKTKGNLTGDEESMLLDLSGKLKMSYLEISKAAVKAVKEKAKARP